MEQIWFFVILRSTALSNMLQPRRQHCIRFGGKWHNDRNSLGEQGQVTEDRKQVVLHTEHWRSSSGSSSNASRSASTVPWNGVKTCRMRNTHMKLKQKGKQTQEFGKHKNQLPPYYFIKLKRHCNHSIQCKQLSYPSKFINSILTFINIWQKLH